MIDKPPHGSPCNNCGHCCRSELCPLAWKVFGRIPGPCPALEPIDNGGGTCGLIQNPQAYARVRALTQGVSTLSKAAAFLIGAGRGCDALLEDEPINMQFRERMLAGNPNRREARAAKRAWGIRD